MAEGPKALPADLLRALISVSRTESISKTSRHLGINQKAVVGQVARIEQMLGQPLIENLRGRRAATELGILVMNAARGLLAASDLASKNTLTTSARIRLGVSSIFVEKFASGVGEIAANEVLVSSSVCTELVKSFTEHRLDVVMVLDVKDHRQMLRQHIVDEHEVRFVWIKTSDFVSDPRSPIPLAVWPGDGLAVRTLDAARSSYRTMFSSNDYFAKLAAVRSGKYVSMMPRNALKPPFIEAEDEFLPALPSANALIAVRGDRASPRIRQITAKLATSHLV